MEHDRLAPLKTYKALGRKIAMLTGYDYPMARLLDEAGVDLILVGDTLGMVVLGYPDTTSVTLDDIIHHTRAAARGASRAGIVADLPIHTYDTSEAALSSGRRLIEAGAHAVKLEGGADVVPQVRALTTAGIPVVGHIGMLPQKVREEGGYKIKGKSEDEVARLQADALALEEAGASAIVIELVRHDAAGQISAALRIPTIGIAAGDDCDGQVLVIHDLIGLYPWFTPKFVTPVAQVSETIRSAAQGFVERVRALGALGALGETRQNPERKT